jgi:biopolymer transport protein ExbD
MFSTISKIDITPLVGVALILVIVFMVTSPMMMSPVDMDIDLPKAKTIEARSQSNITISYSKDQYVALNETQVAMASLEVELRKIIEKYPERLVVIRADKQVTHKHVLRLLSIAKKAGAIRIAIATLQRNREKV